MNTLSKEYTVFVATCTLLWTQTNKNKMELSKVVDFIEMIIGTSRFKLHSNNELQVKNRFEI